MRMDIRCSFKGVLMPEVENYRRRAIPFSAIPFCEPHSAKNECSLNECPLIVYSKRSLVGCCKHLLVAHCKRLFEVIVCENYIKIHRNLHRLFFIFYLCRLNTQIVNMVRCRSASIPIGRHTVA